MKSQGEELSIKELVTATYGHHLRVRVCGILVENEKILLVKHKGIGHQSFWWAPPGGGVEFGETLEEALIRELKEEVGLTTDVKRFLWFEEFVRPPFHALEFFFEVKKLSYDSQDFRPNDPELPYDNQMIEESSFKTLQEVKNMGVGSYHRLFDRISDLSTLFNQPYVLQHQQGKGF